MRRKRLRKVAILRRPDRPVCYFGDNASSRKPEPVYVFKIFDVSKKKPYFTVPVLICDKQVTLSSEKRTRLVEIYNLLCEGFLDV